MNINTEFHFLSPGIYIYIYETTNNIWAQVKEHVTHSCVLWDWKAPNDRSGFNLWVFTCDTNIKMICLKGLTWEPESCPWNKASHFVSIKKIQGTEDTETNFGDSQNNNSNVKISSWQKQCESCEKKKSKTTVCDTEIWEKNLGRRSSSSNSTTG